MQEIAPEAPLTMSFGSWRSAFGRVFGGLVDDGRESDIERNVAHGTENVGDHLDRNQQAERRNRHAERQRNRSDRAYEADLAG